MLRSKSPDLVLQEIWGISVATTRSATLMWEAAHHADVDPDRVSFVAALCNARRSLMNRLPRHPVAVGHIGHGRTVVQLLEHCLISPFHDVELNDHSNDPLDQHGPTCPSPRRLTATDKHKWQAATEVTVAQLPEQRPETVTRLSKPHCPA